MKGKEDDVPNLQGIMFKMLIFRGVTYMLHLPPTQDDHIFSRESLYTINLYLPLLLGEGGRSNFFAYMWSTIHRDVISLVSSALELGPLFNPRWLVQIRLFQS